MPPPSSVPTESTVTALSVTCGVCQSPQSIDALPTAAPLLQTVCERCGTNLVLVASDSSEATATVDRVDPPPTGPPAPARTGATRTAETIAATAGLFLVNLAIVSILGYYAFLSFQSTYDPYDLSDRPYAPLLLRVLGWSSLHIAAAQGDETEVARLLSQGVDVAAKNGRGETPLHEAAKRGHTKIVAILLQHGGTVDERGAKNMTPLHEAAWYGHAEVAKQLTAQGAQLNLTATDGVLTPLHMAAQRGDAEVALVLLNAGADTNARNKSKETPLHVIGWYRWRENTDVAELLLDHGADLDARDDLGFAPLNRAARQGASELAALLIERGAELETQTIKGTVPLYQAAWAGDLDTVRLLLDRGATVNARNIEGYTPLITAVTRNHPDVVHLLLERGANPNLTMSGKTALEFAESGTSDADIKVALQKHHAQTYPVLRQHILRGGALYQQHQYQQALEEQTRAVALAPSDPDLYYLRALTHLCLNAFADARRDLEKAIELNPLYFEAYHQLTYVLSQQRKPDASVPYWNRLIALAPKHARARYERGFVILNREGRTATDLAQALEDLRISCQYGFQDACQVHERERRKVPS